MKSGTGNRIVLYYPPYLFFLFAILCFSFTREPSVSHLSGSGLLLRGKQPDCSSVFAQACWHRGRGVKWRHNASSLGHLSHGAKG